MQQICEMLGITLKDLEKSLEGDCIFYSLPAAYGDKDFLSKGRNHKGIL